MCSLEAEEREAILQDIKKEAIELAVTAGADRNKTQVSVQGRRETLSGTLESS